ncbi:TetR/AcrR family transcriptional regulator [Nocardioides caeni]|uniref:TetR/AcrR family transcriptional regulator n=1 Tax=Nocardioides caeni TaxID=574700 RepID=A0A4S8NC36_9ACTN|nr:TetR/AcrR family transcriptional regulator [Nocardioides caeni]THV13362.1 TetR/AcrR family transcriptional regulator [Nocardioides caeni]
MTATEDEPELDGRRRRWQEHNQVRRQLIIDAALAVLMRQEPGEDIQVQAVADQAGMSRTVVYRHFEDRADLDRAVQRRICDELWEQLLPALAHDGTPDQVISRIIRALIDWAVAQPSLLWFVGRDVADWGPSPLSQAIEQVAEAIEGIMTVVVMALGVELSEDDLAALDPWVFGLIGAVFAAVRRWLERDTRAPAPEVFAAVLSESVWVQIDGIARTRGVSLPDLPIAEFFQMLRSDEERGE